jgi:hypothetical protein
MYMNCAVVDVVPKGSNDNDDKDKKRQLVIPEPDIEKRDTQHANAAAQKALSSYPGLFVANLKSINDCVTKETQDVIFDTPGKSVQFADGQKSSAKPSFGKGKCTGKGSKSAGSSSPNSSSPPPSSPDGDNGQWQPSEPSKLSDGTNCNDGQYHPACYGGPDAQKAITADSTPTAKSTSLTPAQATAALNEQGQQQVSDVSRNSTATSTPSVQRARKRHIDHARPRVAGSREENVHGAVNERVAQARSRKLHPSRSKSNRDCRAWRTRWRFWSSL